MEPSLRFTETLYHDNDLNNMLLVFRERGFVTLPRVFERETVDAFRRQVEAALVEGEDGRIRMPDDSPLAVWPSRAPRIRQMLPGALSHAAMKPHPSMLEASWLISRSGPPVTADKGWHKDRDHEGMPGQEYHYPRDVHLALYLEDMETEKGPTEAVPRSHRDPSLSPFNGSEREAFMPRKEDVVLWDQRLWHRGTSRTTPGLRMLVIYGYYGVPVYGPDRRRMSEAQRQAMLNAKDYSERVYFGGAFAPLDE